MAKNKSMLEAGHDSFPLTIFRAVVPASIAKPISQGRADSHGTSAPILLCGEKFAGAAPDKASLTLLYPLYEIDRGLVSNSYAIGGTLGTRANSHKKRHELSLQQ